MGKETELTQELYDEVLKEIIEKAREEWFLPPHSDVDYVEVAV